MGKAKKDKVISLYLTEERYSEINSKAEELDMSVSSFCMNAIDKNFDKVKKIDPKTLTIDPIDIYHADIEEAFQKVGNVAKKIQRQLATWELTKNFPKDYELDMLGKWFQEYVEAEKEFKEIWVKIYEDREKLSKQVIKRVDQKIKALIEDD